MDDEHRELIDYYHAVVDALREDGEDHAFPERLNDLREWLSRHFQSEESALQKIGCEEVYQHKKEHRQFIRTLDDFKNNSQKIYVETNRQLPNISSIGLCAMVRHMTQKYLRIYRTNGNEVDRIVAAADIGAP